MIKSPFSVAVTRRMIRFALTTLLLLVSLMALLTKPQTATAQTSWQLVWNDEFNGAIGSGPDTSKWNFDVGGWGWGNNELQFYTHSNENAKHIADVGASDGKALEITARYGTNPYTCWYGACQYTSTRLFTKNKFTFQYGKFEVRAKVTMGRGVWPAFWLLGEDIETVGWPQCGEIDVMEVIGKNPTQVFGTLHGPGYSGGSSEGHVYERGVSYDDGQFHTFTVEWRPGEFKWYVDGIFYGTKTPADLPSGTQWVYDHPFFMLLNLAVGNNEGFPGVANSADYPQYLTVDYVRVWRDPSLPSFTPTPTKASSTAYSGTAVTLPARIEAENFDRGGEGIAWHELDGANQGLSAYRPDAPSVDIADITVPFTGKIVNYFGGNEWLNYKVNVPTTGTYTMMVNHAGPGSIFHLEHENGANLGYFTLPRTAASNEWGTYKVYSALVSLPAGTYSIKFFSDATAGNLNNIDYIEFASGAVPSITPTSTATPAPSTPFYGTPFTLPTTIQSEDFDRGGDGAAFHETTPTNLGNSTYRSDSPSVDVVDRTSGGRIVNYLGAGEWLRYAVNVPTAGIYTMQISHAGAGGGTFHLETNSGVNLTGVIMQPATADWDTYATYQQNVYLPAGSYSLIFRVDSFGGNLNNMDYISFTGPISSATATFTPSTTSVVPPTNTQVVPPTNTPVVATNTAIVPSSTPISGCGTTNDALNRTATALTTETAAYPASAAVDGNAATRWSSSFGDPQWIYVDLGSTKTICRVRLNWEAAYASAYQIQTSTDAVNWSTIYTTVSGNGSIDDLTGLNGSGRYVRMYGTTRATPYGYSLWDFEVYTSNGVTPSNTPVPPTATRTNTAVPATATHTNTITPATATRTNTVVPPTVTPSACGTINDALNRTATALTTETAAYPASAAVDGNIATRWSSLFSDPQWIYVDLGSTKTICRVRLNWEAAYASAYQIQVSNDAANWSTIYTTTSGNGAIDDLTSLSGSGRYVRMYGTTRATPYGYSLWDFEVYTSGGVTPTNTPIPPTATRTNTPIPFSNTLYLIDGGTLAASAGTGALTDTISTAGGGNWDGNVHNPLTYTISGITATYNASATLQFNLFIDANTAVGNASQVRISYDFTGDGTYDRLEIYNYFATDPVASWENYTQANNIKSVSGSYANLSNGRVRVEIWNTIGNGTTDVRTSATAANGNPSRVVIPFN